MVVSLHDVPGTHYGFMHVIDQAAGDATNYIASWVAPYKLKLTKVQFVPSDAVTGADTNTRHLNLDSGAGALGTEIANIDFVLNTNGTAGTASALTLTSTTANLTLTADTVLRLESEKIGTGIALPVGVLVLQFTPA